MPRLPRSNWLRQVKTYDYAGRLKTMTNWSAFPSAGARVTTWDYSALRGWLSGKRYDGSTPGPLYTNTAAGRLASRTWARGLRSTYTYTPPGDLAGVTASTLRLLR